MKDNFLVSIGLSRTDNKSTKIFGSIFPEIIKEPYDKPSEFMSFHWEKYKNINKSEKYDNSINGHIFEYLIGVLLYRENIKPVFLGAEVAFVPNVIFDLMLYDKEKGPICISAKTTLRERYKQADLEAFVLKNVHRNARSYLLTFSSREAASLKKKIASGDVLGLNDVICADSKEFDDLIAEFHQKNFVKPQKVEVITSTGILE